MTDKIAKLPKWAQDHIQELQRQRDIAVRALNEYCDSQTPSEMYVEENECTGEQEGPSVKVRYIQGQRMNFLAHGVLLSVYTGRENYIELSWSAPGWRQEDIAFIPSSNHQARLVSKENMR